MATVNKNFRIKQGLIVEGTTGTINGQNILTETGADNYILNLVGGATLVKSVEATQLEVNGAGKLSVKSGVFDPAGSAAAAQSAAEATAASDATSKANAAQSAAITAAATDATTKVAAEAALRVSGDAASVSTAAADATAKANAAQAAAEATAAAALSTAISTEVSNRNTAISTAVDSLVDGAPALLNTLNELAAAINDDANYTTTLTSALATKANSSDVTANIATAVSTAAADATSKANAAQAAAEATAAAANTAQQNGTTAFTALNVNDQAKQIAASSTSLGSVIVTAYEWPKADYRSGKFLVKIDNGTHNEISEILLTLDSSDNVAITEYAIVGTNGSRGSITAIVSGANVQIRVNPVNDSTIKVTGTLLK